MAAEIPLVPQNHLYTSLMSRNSIPPRQFPPPLRHDSHACVALGGFTPDVLWKEEPRCRIEYACQPYILHVRAHVFVEVMAVDVRSTDNHGRCQE
jgi:hypothetical protein